MTLINERARNIVSISYWKTLFYNRCICTRDKQRMVKHAAYERYEKALDVLSLYQTHTNLLLYLDLVMTKAQKLLFLHHKQRFVKVSSKSSDESDSQGPLTDLLRLQTDSHIIKKERDHVAKLLSQIDPSSSIDR